MSKTELGKLMEELNAKCASPGAKKALAQYLRVPLPRVYEWLSGKYQPGGEIALKMKVWKGPESKKTKGSGRVTSTAKATAKTKVLYEKETSFNQKKSNRNPPQRSTS